MNKYVNFKGKRYKVRRSSRNIKKFMIIVNGKKIHFGSKGFNISPGTKKGDSYCARSSGIKSKKKGITPNKLSRKMWKCRGKKSIK